MIYRNANFIRFGVMSVKQAMLNVKILVVTLCSGMRNKAKARLDKLS